ncbi:SgcJ/EcaC family oxidoreductase [Pimelobacter simplex]|uniref:SgcJ/EcaC family oxidoreductase n=1 Tax=Nocardioides simplex TaxID=2045 RepID=A0A7J5DRM4_NOCSI|nr:SgcJ/EcaC family oxidoreductase [Pimelobacter simplex]KAB2807518.1 SgcJ/EcaC family oxidoreductase [Pimelobacter simplex]
MTTTTTTTAADATAEIDAVLAATYQAWADNDADAFVRHYTEDATALLPGSLRAGRTAVRDAMAAGFAGPLRGSRTVDRRLSLRFAGADAAIAVHESGILLAGETEVPAERRVNATWVFEKRDGRWMIAAYHNSPA